MIGEVRVSGRLTVFGELSLCVDFGFRARFHLEAQPIVNQESLLSSIERYSSSRHQFRIGTFFIEALQDGNSTTIWSSPFLRPLRIIFFSILLLPRCNFTCIKQHHPHPGLQGQRHPALLPSNFFIRRLLPHYQSILAGRAALKALLIPGLARSAIHLA